MKSIVSIILLLILATGGCTCSTDSGHTVQDATVGDASDASGPSDVAVADAGGPRDTSDAVAADGARDVREFERPTVDMNCDTAGCLCIGHGCCTSADDCLRTGTWDFPDQVRCLRDGTCIECASDSECGEDQTCFVDDGECYDLPTCDVVEDCGGTATVHKACVDGICVRCTDDAECADDEICYTTNETFYCTAVSAIEPECLDETCSEGCSWIRDDSGRKVGVACKEKDPGEGD